MVGGGSKRERRIKPWKTDCSQLDLESSFLHIYTLLRIGFYRLYGDDERDLDHPGLGQREVGHRKGEWGRWTVALIVTLAEYEWEWLRTAARDWQPLSLYLHLLDSLVPFRLRAFSIFYIHLERWNVRSAGPDFCQVNLHLVRHATLSSNSIHVLGLPLVFPFIFGPCQCFTGASAPGDAFRWVHDHHYFQHNGNVSALDRSLSNTS